MLETERQNTESETERPASAGGSAASGDPDGGAAGGRGLFRRARRAVTRPAGPPGPEPAGRPDQAEAASAQPGAVPVATFTAAASPGSSAGPGSAGGPPQAPVVIFQPPDVADRGGAEDRQDDGGGAATTSSRRRSRSARGRAAEDDAAPRGETGGAAAESAADAGAGADRDGEGETGTGKRRRRGRGRAKAPGADEGVAGTGSESGAGSAAGGADGAGQAGEAGADGGARKGAGNGADGGAEADEASAPGRRRRRRRRSGSAADADSPSSDDPPDTVVHVREPRAAASDVAGDVRAVKGSTRLEAKRQRRREGRESTRRRPPIITESEFLARREAVERQMVVRQHRDRTQIAVLEDGVLVEHYVDRASHQSYVGNVYLGKVQNVLPSMEAAFVDIGKGRNAVLYAGEVNFDATGLEGESKRIESALKSGQSILVQVTKDPIGHKGARLTSQVSLPGRYLVYVPGASTTGISRKLPDTERTRLKQILKQVMPESAGVIVRTAAEGASQEELAHDVARLTAQWEAIERKSKSATAPELLYSEPDLTIRVVRDIFNEDFTKLVIASDNDWDLVDEYVRYVAPSLADRLQRWDAEDGDVFSAYRIDEQLAKALERKVWLPSGGSLVIDTTEAMTVIDVNTGRFTGQGGNLEQTVTRNNLEAAEEIVRQLRLRDVGGIIVIDFIDMVLESNRELVLRRLLECLARDRTKHQVAEVTSLGLVQMTRKRVGSGLLEAFSVPCEHCNGRGVIVSLEPVDHAPGGHAAGGSGNQRERDDERGDSGGRGGSGRRGGRGRGGRSRAGSGRGAGADAEGAAADGADATDAAEASDSDTAAGAPGISAAPDSTAVSDSASVPLASAPDAATGADTAAG
jgi:ribonuclease E